MITPKYWARAIIDEDGRELAEEDGQHGIHGVGWSDQSASDAHQHALNRARKIRDWIFQRDGDGLNGLENEYYPDRVLREPVVDELFFEDRRIAVVTRNIYGAYVLNAEQALFIDIDEPRQGRKRKSNSQPGFFARLFGAKAEPEPETTAAGSFADRIRSIVERQPEMGLKLYRTPNGYRGLVTHRTYVPGSDEAKAVLTRFAADTLYAKLCEAQQCFRARLTPKPYRIRMDNPPRGFPFTNPQKQAMFDKWNESYELRCNDFSACEPLSDQPWGNAIIHPEVAAVLAMHDTLACSAGKPLA